MSPFLPVPKLMNNEASLGMLKLVDPFTKEIFRVKRFLPVPGYLTPNAVTANLVGNTMIAAQKKWSDVNGSDAAIMAMACWQSAHYWPMYAVTQELALAMLMTEPPEDVVWKELHWPIPAATFLLPDIAEVRKHFDTDGPIGITAGRIAAYGSKPGMTEEAKRILDNIKMPGGTLERDMLIVTYYDRKLQSPCLHDLTIKPEWTLAESTDEKNLHTDGHGLLTLEPCDMVRMRRCAQMLINLISFCSSDYMPKMEEAISAPMVLRKEKAKNGKVVTEGLAGVRWLGVGYRRKYVSHGGHHASPKDPFWRKGHQRWQPFGPGRKQKKLIWIEPYQCCLGKPDATPQ